MVARRVTLLLASVLLAAAPALPPLHQAAFDGDDARVRALIEKGADVNAAGPREWTPLHFAVVAGKAEAAGLLLERGADANARGQYDLAPLHWAALEGRAELVPLLVARGARTEARNLYGMTPLMLAADERVVAALLAAGASLKAVDDQGMTALHLARSKEVGKALLDKGADLNVRSRDGRSLMDMVVVNTLLPEGLLIYGRRGSGRLRGERASLEVSVLNVSARDVGGLSFRAESRACAARVSPETIAALAPGQMSTFAVALERTAGVDEGEYPLTLAATAGDARLGTFELLSVDTSRGTTPEDRGMIRLGKVSLTPQPSRAYYLVFAAVPLLAVLGWLWRRKRGG